MVSHIHLSTTAAASASVAQALVSIIFARAMVVYELSIADKQPLSLSQFFAINIKQYLSLIAVGIVVAVLALLSVFTLFIGLIWIIPWLAAVAYVVVDKDLGPFAALGESRRLARHHKGKVWAVIGWIFLISIIIEIIGRLPYTPLLIMPAGGVIEASALAILYRWMQQNAGASPTPTPPPTVPAAT
jgi:uncharacterized membrane protein